MFCSKLFTFLVIRLLVCLRAFSPYFLLGFLKLFLNILFCLYCFLLSRHRFSLPSFAVPSDLFPLVVLFVLFVLLFPFSPNLLQRSSFCLSMSKIFLSTFPVKFSTQVFCSNSLGEHRFYHSLIYFQHSSFNSVTFFVEICVNNSYIISVSALQVL